VLEGQEVPSVRKSWAVDRDRLDARAKLGGYPVPVAGSARLTVQEENRIRSGAHLASAAQAEPVRRPHGSLPAAWLETA
jgi:hypothetical protein